MYIFIGPETAKFLGIKQILTFTGILPFILISINFSIYSNKLVSVFKNQFILITIGIVLVIVRLVIGQNYAINNEFHFLILPYVFFILVSLEKNKSIIFYLLLFFFVCECCLSIYEKFYSVIIFPSEIIQDQEVDNIESWLFRSNSFLGHPLNNALCVSIMMAFIIISNLKNFVKSFLILLGYISLLCFNARAAILIWTFLILVIIIKNFRNSKFKFSIISGVVIFIAAIFYFYNSFLHQFELGGRLLNNGIIDGSAQTRLSVFNAFYYMDTNTLLLGDINQYLEIMRKLGAAGIENSFVVLIITYGFLFSFLIVICLYRTINLNLVKYNKVDKYIIIIAFIVLGSTNNGLNSADPWKFYILCVASFPYGLIKNKSLFIGK